jgi:hypothetical protein
LPAGAGTILQARDAGTGPRAGAAPFALTPGIERVGKPRAPPSLHEVDVV